MNSWLGRRFEVSVGAVAHGGHCVARHEGRVVFVRHTLPGEHVVVKVTEDRGGSFCRGDAVAVLAPSPDRVPAPCPVAAPGGCGGCDWQHASWAAQRALKADVVAEQLRRLAGVTWPVEVEELPGGPLRWRTRARLTVDSAGRPGFRAHRSHRVVPVTDCPISAYGTVDAVADRTWPAGAALTVSVDALADTHVAVDGEGGGVAVERAARREWRVSADGFWQAHPDAADVYAEVVEGWTGLEAGESAWDLYAGVGLFASVLAEQVGPTGTVMAVESFRPAAVEAAENLADLKQVRVLAGKVEAVLRAAEGPDPAVVVLDPPRKGAGREVVEAIAARTSRRVVYIACDPAALARDVATFRSEGFTLEKLRAFDAFPMTHHVECVALFTRS
ncbi:class I SAM-dependent RNA methyltransferase [Actinophytocola oryzae]|uniref:23S rRNA m(5)U-1939 methyltransferase n=1 Tax=Actinophytocola oryzae TaxID=502181 RepID=A0A4R7VZ40_9PSEU|nr:class I SAM-dependent RNA methyltransferase [Actinophytocola oryzae]TDV55453.1 23S rRNA m(5)U-1939 methyltransferase [Actinophytocola oryzae]